MKSTIADYAVRFDRALGRYLTFDDEVPPRLADAMRYSALAPGKRLRPFLVLRACELTGGTLEDALPAAGAVECVHAFSLVHDDLPAMDNDDVRRGQPTTHKKFGEAEAILAGDALLTFAFELLTTQALLPDRARAAAAELARAVGPSGMIGGQMMDIESEGLDPDVERVRRIHERKTARLFEACGRLGAISAGASASRVDALGRYGRNLGLAFQIADDTLDVTASTDALGKTAGKDARARKQTYPRCMSVEDCRREADRLARRAVEDLREFDSLADDLRKLAYYVARREK